jgi:Tol biopolymer transport system component
MKTLLLLSAAILLIQESNAETDSLYFGQTPAGNTAVIFAPEFFSKTHPLELKMAFSPDGKELYYSVYTDSFKIYYTKRVNNTWTEPKEAPFSVKQNALSPSFSVDGNSLYFSYFNPTNYINKIYKVERTEGGWSEPQILPSPINITNESDYAEISDSVAYISSNRNHGDWDIWCMRLLPDSSFQAVSLGSLVNSNGQDSYPCVAPDGSYLIFSSTRSGSYGNQDLYICFNKGNNILTAPVNMERSGAKINVANSYQDYPSISPDGKFLFFRRANYDFSITNVYWVSTHVIDTLKKIAIPSVSVTKIVEQNVDRKSVV